MSEEPAIDMKKLGLKPREMQVMRRAVWALGQVPNGHYLTADGERAAALRLIERGFLTRPPHEFSPPAPEWVVICLMPENTAALRAANTERTT